MCSRPRLRNVLLHYFSWRNSKTIAYELSERLSKINILQQKKGLKRNTIDKFYTKENIVNQCLEAIKSNLNILEEDLEENSVKEEEENILEEEEKKENILEEDQAKSNITFDLDINKVIFS